MTNESSTARGFSLIEVMIAMGVMLLGAIGLMGLHNMGVALNGDAARVTRATAIAQDMLTTLESWPYDEAAGPFVKVSATNADDIGDHDQEFESSDDPVADGLADHGEDDIAAMGAAWHGVPDPDGVAPIYQRFWNVAYGDSNGDGTFDGVEIAVIVRWQHGGGWRRVVLYGAKPNPGRG